MILFTRLLLAYLGLICFVSSVWFFGEDYSFASLAAGVSLMAWAITWDATELSKIFCLASLTTAVATTVWIGAHQHLTSTDASYISLVTPAVALIGGYMWVRDNLESIL